MKNIPTIARYKKNISPEQMLQEKQLLTLILSKIDPNDEDLSHVQITFQELRDKTGITDFMELRAVVSRFMSRVVNICTPKVLTMTHLISTVHCWYSEEKEHFDIYLKDTTKFYLIEMKREMKKTSRMKVVYLLDGNNVHIGLKKENWFEKIKNLDFRFKKNFQKQLPAIQ